MSLIQYREKPLTMEEFSKLELHASRFMTIREKLVSKPVPRVGSDGEVYGWERDLVTSGVEVFFKTQPDDRVMEAISRPATRQAIGMHLQRLYDHKPYGRGVSGWQTVVEDLIHDLDGCSEWALLKACEGFRLDTELTFFPDTAKIVSAVRSLDEQIRWAYAGRPSLKKAEVQAEEPKPPKPTDETRAKVAKTLHDAGIPHDKEFCKSCSEAL